jgi:NADH:ubiquinone oxidoreductase subunit 6 (subunit J)
MLAIRWLQGEAVWQGASRWIMAGLAILGSALLGIAGTLGGHLVGVYTEVSEALRFLGWEVYTTYYVPNATLAAIVIAAGLLAAIGILGRRRAEA